MVFLRCQNLRSSETHLNVSAKQHNSRIRVSASQLASCSHYLDASTPPPKIPPAHKISDNGKKDNIISWLALQYACVCINK